MLQQLTQQIPYQLLSPLLGLRTESLGLVVVDLNSLHLKVTGTSIATVGVDSMLIAKEILVIEDIDNITYFCMYGYMSVFLSYFDIFKFYGLVVSFDSSKDSQSRHSVTTYLM